MKCAHCKRQDDTVTVAHVKACAGQGTVATLERPTINQDALDKFRNHRPSPIVAAARQSLGRTATDVPAGHYALLMAGGEETDGEPVWKFFEVDRPTEGKWKGYTFLSRCASDDRWPIRGRAERTLILELIGRDVATAMADYGKQIGKCGKCHRTLTNPESIGRGIGPDCWEQLFG